MALTSTPSMRPSSCELTCPVNAAPGELAAPMTLNAAENSVTAAAMAIARKVFFSIELLPKPIRVILEIRHKLVSLSTWFLLGSRRLYGEKCGDE